MTDPLRRELPEETTALIYELIMSARVYGRLDTHAALSKMEKAEEALREHIAREIARARAEERERAAKIAAPVTPPGDTPYDKQAYDIRRLIADAIMADDAAIRARGGE